MTGTTLTRTAALFKSRRESTTRVCPSRGGRKIGCCLFVGCLTPQQQAIVYLRDGSAQTSLRAATLR